MTGLDKITSQIQEEAEDSAKERIEAAQKEAEQILADAKAACEAMEKEASDKAAALKTVQDGRIHSAAEQKRKTALLKAKQEIIAEIIGSAYQTLKEEDTASYFLTMEKLVKTYALADKGEIYFSAADLGRMPADFREKNRSGCTGERRKPDSEKRTEGNPGWFYPGLWRRGRELYAESTV